MASHVASHYGVDNNNNHSAVAVFFAESRATAAAIAPAAPIATFSRASLAPAGTVA
ncbi:hypothetical protein E4U40_003144 [Claviceps sp. LM458 group G5]|nr:hypothetical protein E4U40_003144 [Claviceps sp. LM458 group G5]